MRLRGCAAVCSSSRWGGGAGTRAAVGGCSAPVCRVLKLGPGHGVHMCCRSGLQQQEVDVLLLCSSSKGMVQWRRQPCRPSCVRLWHCAANVLVAQSTKRCCMGCHIDIYYIKWQQQAG